MKSNDGKPPLTIRVDASEQNPTMPQDDFPYQNSLSLTQEASVWQGSVRPGVFVANLGSSLLFNPFVAPP
jgi:hypothetical protein